MADADRGAADHLAAAQALLPTGAVWPRHQGTTQARVLGGIAAGVARLRARARALLIDAFPSTSLELLPEWEETLGLPDRCAGPAETLQGRRAAVAARLTARGGQSVPYVVSVAASLGFAVTIQEHKPFCFGDPYGAPQNSEAWAHALTVRAPAATVGLFRYGESGFGEPFAAWGNAPLECAIRRIAPAHAVLIFAYGD